MDVLVIDTQRVSHDQRDVITAAGHLPIDQQPIRHRGIDRLSGGSKHVRMHRAL